MPDRWQNTYHPAECGEYPRKGNPPPVRKEAGGINQKKPRRSDYGEGSWKDVKPAGKVGLVAPPEGKAEHSSICVGGWRVCLPYVLPALPARLLVLLLYLTN
mgnify:CR=1 FL=1